jgi:hypothetical protein
MPAREATPLLGPAEDGRNGLFHATRKSVNGRRETEAHQAATDHRWDGLDEFIRRNADPMFLHRYEMWVYMESDESDRVGSDEKSVSRTSTQKPGQLDRNEDDDIPF